MNPISKLLIGCGIILILVGVIWQLGEKFIPLGRLPGDLMIERENFRIYFPLATSLLISLIGSLLLYFFRHR